MRCYTVTSLFSGCGGKDLGFVASGFRVQWANDIDRAACQTYSENVGKHIVCKDIRDIPSDEVPESDVVIGGFPCQGFSIVGTRRLNDERNFLYRELKRIVNDKRPAFFVAENVRGILNLAGGRVIATIVQEFKDLGYKVDYKLLNARDFGTPQHRERVIIVGNRLGLPNPFPAVTHGTSNGQTLLFDEGKLERYRTLRDAIGDIETLGGLPNHEIMSDWVKKRPYFLEIMKHLNQGQKLCNVRLGPRSVFTWDIPEVFGEVTQTERHLLEVIAGNRRRNTFGEKDGNPLSLATIEQLARLEDASDIVRSLVEKDYLIKKDGKYELKNAFNGIFRRMRWDEPCEAVLTVFASPRYYVHPSQHRPFSVREVARIQDFPDTFIFHGSLKEQYTQIGNAVPQRLAQAVSTVVMKALQDASVKPCLKHRSTVAG
ncbi:MAG: DNA cytosine methyltransferase [Pirellulaceae bacterium]